MQDDKRACKEVVTPRLCDKRAKDALPVPFSGCAIQPAESKKQERKTNMNENKNAVRKTVYMDEELERRCEILFGEAGAKSFSDFVSKALEFYIDKLITGAHGYLLTEELSQAIRDEVRPIASRLSKGLYRYAVMLDMLCQIIAYQDTQWTPDDLELLRRFANVRVAKMRGKIDLEALLNDNWFGNEREENTEDYL